MLFNESSVTLFKIETARARVSDNSVKCSVWFCICFAALKITIILFKKMCHDSCHVSPVFPTLWLPCAYVFSSLSYVLSHAPFPPPQVSYSRMMLEIVHEEKKKKEEEIVHVHPILTIPAPSWQFIVEFDASSMRLGGVLSQRSTHDNKMHSSLTFYHLPKQTMASVIESS